MNELMLSKSFYVFILTALINFCTAEIDHLFCICLIKKCNEMWKHCYDADRKISMGIFLLDFFLYQTDMNVDYFVNLGMLLHGSNTRCWNYNWLFAVCGCFMDKPCFMTKDADDSKQYHHQIKSIVSKITMGKFQWLMNDYQESVLRARRAWKS